MKTFPEGIHGTKDGCGEYINDFILYYTVKAVKARLKDTGKIFVIKFNSFFTDLKSIFKYVYQCFPNKASKHELLTM